MGTDGTPGAKGPTVSNYIDATQGSDKHSVLTIA